MRKFTLLKTMLLLVAFVAGCGNVWGADITTTYEFTNAKWAATCDGESANWTSGKDAYGFTTAVQITKSYSGAYATSPVSFTDVKKIVITYFTNASNGAGTINVQVGSGTEKSSSVTSTGGATPRNLEYTFSPYETGNVKLTVNCTTNSIYIKSITITTEGATTLPVINAEDTDINYNNTEGSVAFSIQNAADDGKLTASCTSGSEWLTVGTVSASSVPFTATVNNTSDTREATIKLTYTYDTNKTVTKNVTVTQGTSVNYVWVETDLADLTTKDIFVIVGKNTKTYAMSNDNGTTSAPEAVEVTVSEGTLTGTVATNLQWNISGNATDGYTFYPNGSTSTWLYCTNTNNGVRVGTNENKTFTINNDYLQHQGTSRYLGIYNSQDWRCYTSNGGNIENQAFTFYKKAELAPITLNSTCTNAEGKYYGTYSNSKAFVVPADLIVSAVSVADEKLVVTNYKTGDIVEAGTGVLISSTTLDHSVILTDATGTEISVNLLKGTGDAGITAGDMNESNTKFYRLTMHNDTDLGFWWGAENGAAFDYETPNRAYLAVPNTAAAKVGFLLFDETTGIESLPQATSLKGETEWYNLAGQRVAAPQKGIYIKNGKKVSVK